jgi:ribosomal protein S18 acetylase RimI-like enzyme
MKTVTENIFIESATEADLETILEVQKSAFIKEAERHHNYEIPGLNQSLEELANEFNNSLVLTAKLDGTIVGSVRSSCKNGICTISKLVVKPEFHKRGIGRKLLQEIEAKSKEQYPSANTFVIFTAKKSFDNIGLYESAGYEKTTLEFVANNMPLISLEKKL